MLLLFLIPIFEYTSLSKAQDIMVSKCTNKEPELIVMNCSSGRVINIHEAIYVRNKWKACLYTSGDCTEKVEINELCCGQTDCSFPIRKAYSLTCGYVSFFRAIYECVKEKGLTCGKPITHTRESTEKQETTSLHSVTFTTKISKDAYTEATKRSTKNDTWDDLLEETEQDPEETTEPAKVPVKLSHISESQNTVPFHSDMPIIIGSAATVAVLLVAIFVVLFLLRRFSWENEKFCILGLFISMCKRKPPDGSEEPDGLQNGVSQGRDMPDQSEKETKTQIDSNQNVQTPDISLLCQGKIYTNMGRGTVAIPTLSAVTGEKHCEKTPCSLTHVQEGVTGAIMTDV